MQRQRVIIGFGHKRRVGKDLCGGLAVSHLIAAGMPAVQDWFAWSLKAMCQAAFGFSEEQLWGDKKLEVDPFWRMTPARALQLAGTEATHTTFGEDFWVRTVQRRVINSPDTSFVICDVRFPNEAEAIKDMGGYVVRVDRPGVADTQDGRDAQHKSETALDGYAGWSAVVTNDGTLKELKAKVNTLMRDLQQGVYRHGASGIY